MWFDEPADDDRTPIRVPPRARRRDRADGRGRRRRSASTRSSSRGSGSGRSRRRVRPPTRSRASSGAKARSRSTASSSSRSTSPRSASSRPGHGAGPRRARLRHEPRGRLAVRRVRRARARPVLARARRARSVRRDRGRRGQRPARPRRAARRSPTCARALHYVLVERSAALRDEQRERLELEPADEALGPFARDGARRRADRRSSGSGPVFVALDELPALELTGVVLANELLDNLPFGIAECDGARLARRCASRSRRPASFAEVLVPAEAGRRATRSTRSPTGIAVAAGARLPIPRGIDAWFAACGRVLRHGTLVAIDYVDDARGRARARRRRLAAHVPGPRARRAAARRRRARRTSPPTSCASSCCTRPRAPGFALVGDQSQAEWLRDLGIDELVEAGRRTWEARAAHRRPRGAGRPEPRRRGAPRSPIPRASAPTASSRSRAERRRRPRLR